MQQGSVVGTLEYVCRRPQRLDSALYGSQLVRSGIMTSSALLGRIAFVGAFPLTLFLCAVCCWWAISTGADYVAVHSRLILGVLAFYVLLEWALPLRADWSVTPETLFGRDLKFMIVNSGVQALGRAIFGGLAIMASTGRSGVLHGMPIYVALPALLLVFEFLHYWYHRWCHELRGPVGGFLWRVHAAHHLPRQLYALIHTVGHPLDLLVTGILLTVLLPAFLGCSPETAFLFAVFVNHQGMVSHLNVGLRLGWMNYIVAGPEVHRFHHSVHAAEAKNYGAVLMCFDQAFGTFVYRPGQAPAEVGVNDESYPESTEFLKVLTLPFRK